MFTLSGADCNSEANIIVSGLFRKSNSKYKQSKNVIFCKVKTNNYIR